MIIIVFDEDMAKLKVTRSVVRKSRKSSGLGKFKSKPPYRHSFTAVCLEKSRAHKETFVSLYIH